MDVMTAQGRRFGRPHSLQVLMQRGEELFDAITATDIDEVLTRSRRINKIASTAALLAGEKAYLAGDIDPQRLVFAAYLNIGDLTQTVADTTSIDEAREILTSDQTHRTLLLASGALTSVGFDKAITNFRQQGAHFGIESSGLTFDFTAIPKKHLGQGCPYAKGNDRKSEIFKTCTEHVVETYTEAYKRSMPRNLFEHVTRRTPPTQ